MSVDELADELIDQLADYDDESESMLDLTLGLRGGAKAMKAMKAMKAAASPMKAMKVMKKKAIMKAMKASKIAKGKYANALVFRGTKEKTKSGLKKSDLMKNKRGAIVSKKQSAAGQKRYKNIKAWVDAVAKARKALGVKGFVAVKKGTPLYNKAKGFAR